MENNELEIGTKIAVRFLRDYEEFGSLGHLYAADAMLAVIQATNDSDKKKLLAAKIYSEYMAALEDLGAICIAVRHRDEGVGIIYNYLTYETKKKAAPPTSVEKIYGLVKNGDGLKTALRLPPLDEIIQRASTLGINLLSMHYKECNIFLARAGAAYLFNRIYIRAYNKTKHGFAVIRDRHTFQPEEPLILPETLWIVDKNSEYQPNTPTTATMVELISVELKNVQPLIQGIITIRGAIMTICELTVELLERNIITCAEPKT